MSLLELQILHLDLKNKKNFRWVLRPNTRMSRPGLSRSLSRSLSPSLSLSYHLSNLASAFVIFFFFF